jgi:hypothetical protein
LLNADADVTYQTLPNYIIPAQGEFGTSDIPAGDENVANLFLRCRLLCGLDLTEWLDRLAVNAEVATVLGSIPASSDIVESEGRLMNSVESSR